MNELDPERERKILRNVVLQMEDVERTARLQGRLRRIAMGGGSLLAAAVFFLALHDLAHAFVVAFGAFLAGSAVGFSLFLSFAQEQWPVTQRYVDLDRVKARLRELEPQEGAR